MAAKGFPEKVLDLTYGLSEGNFVPSASVEVAITAGESLVTLKDPLRDEFMPLAESMICVTLLFIRSKKLPVPLV